MKKSPFLLAALFAVAPVMAQSDDGEDEIITIKGKNNAFFLGPKIGATMTTMSQPSEGKLYDGVGINFSAGLALKARFGKASENSIGGTGFWGVGLEAKYKNNTVKTLAFDEDGNANVKMNIGYFEVPVYLQVYPLAKVRNMNSFYVELGASFAGTLTRSPKTLTLLNPSENWSSVTYCLDDNGSKLKGYDVRVLAGLGYTIPGTGLDINARYYVGTCDLAGNLPCKMNTAELSIAWMFKVGKF